MNLPFFVAGRYLFAKKSHNVINIVSAISAAGMAIGTAVLIIILSVYNGFDDLITKSLSNVDPDILIVPAKGKVFLPDSSKVAQISRYDCVEDVCGVLQENVFLNYDGQQSLGFAKGVDDISLMKGDIRLCAVGTSLAMKLGINPSFVSMLEIYYPDREAKVSMANPMSNLRRVKAKPSRLIDINAERANSLILLPVSAMRELLGYEKEISALEIRVAPGTSVSRLHKLCKQLETLFSEDFKIKDRYQQNESLYKMMKYEKASIFLILIFIIIIIAFNIFGSLTMLIIDKKGDIETFRSMGAPDRMIRKIFVLEGWLISLSGLAVGLVFGVLFSFLQQKFGIIPMPGNYVVDYYPVCVQFGDILFTVIGVALTGYLIALLPARKVVTDK